jgi:hypothetical protein
VPIKRAIPASASRFVTPAPAASQQVINPIPGQHTFRKPPNFRPPSPSAINNQVDPLPEQFSPHGKGRKYIPGGLAAELQGWLFNIESTSHATPKYKNEEWPIRVIIEEISGDQRSGITMISGRQMHSLQSDNNGSRGKVNTLEEVRVILAGEGQSVGLRKSSKIEIGSVVGIRGPVWEVIVREGEWGVGCDWKVLDGNEYG